MKKIVTSSVIFLSLLAPFSAGAVMQSLNGLSGQNQNFINDLNIRISSSGTNHTLNWSGLLGVNRGGTGASSYATGSVPFFWNGIFENNPENNSKIAFTADQGLIINQGDISLVTGGRMIWFEDEPTVEEDGPSLAVQYASLTSLSSSTIDIYANGSGSYTSAFKFLPHINGTQTFTFPDISGTVSLLEIDQTWSGENTFSKGASATTTVSFGEVGDTSSKSCFNTKNTDGDDISFYFVGTSMVVENNNCR